MNFSLLNPQIVSFGVYERPIRSTACRSYLARLYYIRSGSMTVSFEEGKKEKVEAGSFVFIPAGQTYSVRAEHICVAVAAFIPVADGNIYPADPVPAAEFDENQPMPSAPSPFDAPILLPEAEAEEETIMQIDALFQSEEDRFLDSASALLKLILIHIAQAADPAALPSSMVRSLDTYIFEHLGEEISNTEIGAVFGYHPFYVSRLLKEKKGITLRQYVIAARLRAARRVLMMTKKPIADIAEEYAFTDSSYFTKVFKAEFGETPKEFRNRFKDVLL